MSFHNTQKQWEKWVQQHHDILVATGVPDYIYRNRKRWFVFLDHGYDEVGWFKDKNNYWDVKRLGPEEARHLCEFIQEQYGDSYKYLLSDLRELSES